MLEIFIDTGILYDDPFWKNKYHQLLLERAKRGKINIYISRVVLMEMRQNYLKNILQELNRIIGAKKAINEKYSNTEFEVNHISEESLQTQYDRFYKEHIENGVFKILEAENEILPEIIERAILAKKPFGENKSEFKDAVIWLTYAKFVENNGLEKAYLLSTNTRDFCENSEDRSRKLEIHRELKNDSARFEFFKHSKFFISEVLQKIETQRKSEFAENIKRLNLNENSVFHILLENHQPTVESQVYSFLITYDFVELLDRRFSYSDHFDPTINEWLRCEAIEVVFLEDKCIVYGRLYVELDVEAKHYDSLSRDEGEDPYVTEGTISCEAECPFAFYIDIDGHINDLEIEGVYISENLISNKRSRVF